VAAASSRWVTTTKRVVGRVVDALVLGAVPEGVDSLAETLENGRTVIQGRCRASASGRGVTNGGCVRMPAAKQAKLLGTITDGTVVHAVAVEGGDLPGLRGSDP
jgi:hypothetical protein